MTGTFGGMIRDVLQKEVPLVLQKEIYASACIIGGIVFVVFDILKINNVLNVAISGVVVFLIRFVAIQKNWHLPKAIK
jgi:uncharacterized membrane protein YeiH